MSIANDISRRLLFRVGQQRQRSLQLHGIQQYSLHHILTQGHVLHACMSTPICGQKQLWDKKPSSAFPLKISYAAPYICSKPTPTPPPTTREATTAPASSFISIFVTPPLAASTLAVSSVWYQKLLRYLPSSMVRRAYGLSNVPLRRMDSVGLPV